MTDEELIEQVARAICDADQWCGLYDRLEDDERSVYQRDARAILPIIKAERIRGGEMVKEAAATVSPTKTAADECETVGQWTRRTLREAIRALSVPAIVEAGDAA